MRAHNKEEDIMQIEIFEKDGKEVRLAIYEGYAAWYASIDGDYEDCVTEGRSERQVWLALGRLGYVWKRTEK
jgi:hypothetical protein